MRFLVPVLAVLAASPAAVDAWMLGPSYWPSPFLLTSPNSILRRQQAWMDRALQQGPWTSPRYEIIDNNEKFQLTIEVPGVKMEDIDVSLEEGILTVSGKREAKDDEKHYRYSSQFSQSFSIDPSVEVDKFTANLNNGVLVVGAPKDLKKIEESVRKIVVNQLPDDEVKQLDSKVEEPVEAKETVAKEEAKEKKETVNA